jgi:hypothetical protein
MNKSETIDQRLVTALAHPLRVQILEILTERVASPNAISEELEAGLTHVAYHTRALNRWGCLRLVDTARRRGATEHFYKAAPTSFLGDRRWRRIPRSLRSGVTGATLQTFMDKAIAALEAGAIDDRDDTTFCWMALRLDQRGWKEVTEILTGATEEILAAESRSQKRLGPGTGAEEISAVAAVANFETAASRSSASART